MSLAPRQCPMIASRSWHAQDHRDACMEAGWMGAARQCARCGLFSAAATPPPDLQEDGEVVQPVLGQQVAHSRMVIRMHARVQLHALRPQLDDLA